MILTYLEPQLHNSMFFFSSCHHWDPLRSAQARPLLIPFLHWPLAMGDKTTLSFLSSSQFSEKTLFAWGCPITIHYHGWALEGTWFLHIFNKDFICRYRLNPARLRCPDWDGKKNRCVLIHPQPCRVGNRAWFKVCKQKLSFSPLIFAVVFA